MTWLPILVSVPPAVGPIITTTVKVADIGVPPLDERQPPVKVTPLESGVPT